MLNEFKEFAVKGNMVDMAVGIIIGAAFGTVVKSVVDDILMPIVSMITGAPDFSNLFVVLRNPNNAVFQTVEEAMEAGAVVLSYGQFINATIAFLIVAFVLFIVVKAMNNLKRKEEAAPAPPAEPSNEEKLLTEIRDLLRASSG
ncbi:MAG TPA: large conductance mechanosensitive channel protein MscL [Rhodothermales bacterium]|nr:large conductance mechanosensitive channel protein MscL [Rhodothermales bacterium]